MITLSFLIFILAEKSIKNILPLHILLVEDNAITNMILKRQLSRLGHTIDSAVSIATATPFIRNNKYQLCICDIGLPDGSGLELMPLIKMAQPNVNY